MEDGRPVRQRSLRAAGLLFPAVAVLWIAATAATAMLAPKLVSALAARPVAWLATALFLAGLAGSLAARRAGRDLAAFVASGAFLLGLLGATAASVFPTMIRSIDQPSRSLTAFNASAGPEGLAAGLLWWPFGFVLAIVYAVIVFRLHRGKTRAADGEGY